MKLNEMFNKQRLRATFFSIVKCKALCFPPLAYSSLRL
jgi:hypothetical protein